MSTVKSLKPIINNQKGASVLLIVFGISMLIFSAIGTLHLYVDARARIQRQLHFSNKSFLMSTNIAKILESSRRRWDNLNGPNDTVKAINCAATGGKAVSLVQNSTTIRFCMGPANEDRCITTTEGIRACVCLGNTVGNDLECAKHTIDYASVKDLSYYEKFVLNLKNKYHNFLNEAQNKFDRTLVAAVDKLLIDTQMYQKILNDGNGPTKAYAEGQGMTPTYNVAKPMDHTDISGNIAKFQDYVPNTSPVLQVDPWASSPTLGIAPPPPSSGAWPSALTYQSCPEGGSCPSVRICSIPAPISEPNRTVCFEQRLTRGTCAQTPFPSSWNGQVKPDFPPTSQCSNVYF